MVKIGAKHATYAYREGCEESRMFDKKSISYKPTMVMSTYAGAYAIAADLSRA